MFELDDEKSSARKINRAFGEDSEISVKLYRDANGNVYKVIASSEEDTSNEDTTNQVVDFNATTPNNTAPTVPSAPPDKTLDETPSQPTSQIVPVSQSTEEVIYNNTPSLPKTGESSNALAGLYQVISFVTGFSAIVLFVYAIMLKQKQYTKNS